MWDEVDSGQRVEPIRAFDGAEDLRVAGEHATDILRALCPIDGEDTIVLPAPRIVYLQDLAWTCGSLQEAEMSFITSRRLCGHPVLTILGWSGYPLSRYRRGPMIPQKWYTPHASSDIDRYVNEVCLEPSIHFYKQKSDEEGIPPKDAMHGRFARLVSRDEPMFQERGPSISVRINVSCTRPSP